MAARIIVRRSTLPLDGLPACCARCGSGTVSHVELSLPYTREKPPLKKTEGVDVALHIVLGWASFVAILYVLTRNIVITRRMKIWLPLCERHANSAWWQRVGLRWLSVLLTLCTLGAIIAIVYWVNQGAFKGLNKEQTNLKILGYSMPLILLGGGALLARARLHDGFIYTLDVEEEWVELGGISDVFASQLATPDAARLGDRETAKTTNVG